jgi:hypothetical protein
MEPTQGIPDALHFPTAIYAPNLLSNDKNNEESEWSQSMLNPAARIDSLDLLANRGWDIDGAEPDGQQLWAIPRFARGLPPRRIDFYVGGAGEVYTGPFKLLSDGMLTIASK